MGSQEVARRFRTSHQTFNRIRQHYKQTGQFTDRPHFKSYNEDRYVSNIVARNRFLTGPEVRSRLYAASDRRARPDSVTTVRNRSHYGRFKSRVPAKKPELTQHHNDASRALAGWNSPQLRKVMFSDESMFYLRKTGGRKLVWHNNP